MANFQVLRESYRSTPNDAFVPGLVWVKGEQGIAAYAGLQFSEQLAAANAQLTFARVQGFSDTELWDYLCDHGGNGYTMLRAGPTEESGNNSLEVGLEELRWL